MKLAPLGLALLLALPSLVLAQTDISKVNGSITVEDGQTAGELSTVNGSIRIGANARVDEAETVNGSIQAKENVQVGALSTVNGSIRLEDGARVSGGVETVNGGIFVDRGGNVQGDVETVNGAIGLVDTDVSGGLETVNGDVTVGVGSHVRGGLRYIKPKGSFIRIGKQRIPRVVIGPDARVDGPLVFEREVVLYVHATARTGAITGAQAIRFEGDTPPER